MPAKKGQTFNRYSEKTKEEAVRLRVEEGWTRSRIMEKLGIKSESQIITWVRKSQNGESFISKKAQSEFTRGGKLDFEARCQSIRDMERFQNKLGDLSPIEFREKVAA